MVESDAECSSKNIHGQFVDYVFEYIVEYVDNHDVDYVVEYIS